MPDQQAMTSAAAPEAKKAYRAPTAEKMRLDSIVAGQGSCNFDLTGLRDQGQSCNANNTGR